MIEVIPAILEKDFGEIEKKIHLVQGLVDWVQIDLADNTLVPNTTFLDPEPFTRLITSDLDAGDASEGSQTPASQCLSAASKREFEDVFGIRKRQDPLKYELHMMVKDSHMYLERFAKVGFKRFIAHVEGDYIEDYLDNCRNLGVEGGLAIDGPTNVEEILKYLDRLNVVLVMAIEAGESGRPFREETVEKIKRIRKADPELPIAIDGAMDAENAKKVVRAGATRINSNSYLFNSHDVRIAIEKLMNLE